MMIYLSKIHNVFRNASAKAVHCGKILSIRFFCKDGLIYKETKYLGSRDSV